MPLAPPCFYRQPASVQAGLRWNRPSLASRRSTGSNAYVECLPQVISNYISMHCSRNGRGKQGAVWAAGDEKPNVAPADVVFIVNEKPHALFRREGNDLLHTRKVPLVEALCGQNFTLQTLDGRSLPVTVQSTVGPNSVKVRSCAHFFHGGRFGGLYHTPAPVLSLVPDPDRHCCCLHGPLWGSLLTGT